MWLSGVWRSRSLDWIYCLTCCNETVQKVPIFHRDDTKVLRLPITNIEKILYFCFLKKDTGGPLPSTSIWWEMALAPSKSLCQVFLLEQPLFECTRDLLHNKTIGWLHFMGGLKSQNVWSLVYTKTGWNSSLLLLPPHISIMPHTSGLYCSPSIQISHKTGTSKSLAGSLDDGVCFSTAFVKLMITILFTNN